jgi:hypothetical protein
MPNVAAATTNHLRRGAVARPAEAGMTSLLATLAPRLGAFRRCCRRQV